MFERVTHYVCELCRARLPEPAVAHDLEDTIACDACHAGLFAVHSEAIMADRENAAKVFDTIVGYEGAAPLDSWDSMSYGELREMALALAGEYYQAIDRREAGIIAGAALAYRDSATQDDGWHVRDAMLNAFGGAS